jgi:hypothetical protein
MPPRYPNRYRIFSRWRLPADAAPRRAGGAPENGHVHVEARSLQRRYGKEMIELRRSLPRLMREVRETVRAF